MKESNLLNKFRALLFVGTLSFSLLAVTAFADVTPTVSVSIKNTSNTTITSANIGTVVHASTEVASSTGPTALGTVDFSLYPNTTCSSSAAVQSGVLLASGLADSATTTIGSSGLSYKVHFNGQSGVYAVADSPCVSLSATASATTLNTTLSSTSITVGSSVFQSATLVGVTTNATGTVAYNVYTDNSCVAGAQSAGTKVVASGLVPNSDSVQFNLVGTLYWKAVYSGDQNNVGANGSCQSLSVLATSTPPTPTPGSGSISGTSFNDLNKNKTKDSGEVGIAGFTVKLFGGTFWWNWGNMSAIKTTTTDVSGNYSFTSLADGLYRVEETKLPGWAQTSPDYKWVFVWGGKNITGLDFANIGTASSTKATTTPHKIEKQEKKEEKQEQKEIKKQNKQLEQIEKFFQKFNKGNGKGK